MQFTPHATRLAQVLAAEELLHNLDPTRAYPLDFIIHRVTGYRPREADENLLAGLALQHDLGLLIETVSDGLDLHTAAMPEPVLGIEDVCERFNVTSKTIQRWRRRGLPARRFIFPDGRRRVGFLLGRVERFFSGHREQVARGMNFSQLTDPERGEILRRARRLAVYGGCCPREIARRVARRLNRTPATVLHTIRKHDAEHPDDAVFPLASASVGEDERGRLLRGHRRGLSVAYLAQRSGRPRVAVYRVILEERIARLNARKVRFLDDPLYHQPQAGEAIDAIVSQEPLEAPGQRRPEETRLPRDLPPYLQDLYRTPLLSAARERALFLKFNFHKYQFVCARRKLEPQFAKARDLEVLEGFLRQATETKNAIVQANLRLVVSVARKHLRPGLSLMELVSEGNLTLMRAVEGFDVHRGYRFSTYATLALMKGFARTVPQMLAAGRGGVADERALAALPDHRFAERHQRLLDREHVSQLLSGLEDRERSVLLAQYGLNGQDAPASLDQLARRLGMTRQCVRDIEQSALAKLRAALS